MFAELLLVHNRVRLWWFKALFSFCLVWSDCFWLMDVLLLLGGLRSPLTSNWAHEGKIRCLTNCMFLYQVVVLTLQISDVVLGERDDLLMLAFSLIKSASVILTILKALTIIRSKNEITNLRSFINSDRVYSGDEAFDELQQRNYRRTARTMLRVIYGILLLDSFFLSVPCAANKSILELPSLLVSSGKQTERVLYFFASSLIPLGILPRLLSNIACIGTLFIGMRAKCLIQTHRYSLILKQSFSSPDFDFTQMNHELRQAFIQHQEYMRHFKKLKGLVEQTLFMNHCYSVVCIGGLFYITRNIEISFFSACIVATTATMLLEYLFWCHMADTLQEVADSMGSIIFELCSRMPYSRKQHSLYVNMRTSLMIIWINSCGKQMSMDCYGLFEISTIAFVDLLHTIYSVMMFMKSIV